MQAREDGEGQQRPAADSGGGGSGGGGTWAPGGLAQR